MKRSINTTNLTKDFIESKISQESIVSKYLDIPIEIVNKCINDNILIKSVFRDDDSNNSMGIQFNKKGKLKVRDFGGFGFFEDVYGVVAYVLSLACDRTIDTNNKQDFYFVLKHIAYTFSNVINGTEEDPNVNILIKNSLNKGLNKKAIIEVVTRNWNQSDKAIWAKWGVNLQYLNTHFIVPVDQYYINRTANSNPKYYYKDKDPCYGYILGQNRLGVTLIKLYFPLRDRHKELKFITNCCVLEGLLNLELSNYDYIIITKSTKDRVSLGSYLERDFFYRGSNDKLNVGVINLPSENYKLTQQEYDWLTNKLKDDGMILSFLDFDATGRLGAKYLEETYDIPYLFITRGEFGLPNFECKDFSDLHDKFNKKDINQFIKDTLKYVELRFKRTSEYNTDASEDGLLQYDLPY